MSLTTEARQNILDYFKKYTKQYGLLCKVKKSSEVPTLDLGETTRIDKYFVRILLREERMKVLSYVYTGIKNQDIIRLQNEIYVEYPKIDKSGIKKLVKLSKKVVEEDDPELILEFEDGHRVKRGPEAITFDPEFIFSTAKIDSEGRFNKREKEYLLNLFISEITKDVRDRPELVINPEGILSNSKSVMKFTFETRYFDNIPTRLEIGFKIRDYLECSFKISLVQFSTSMIREVIGRLIPLIEDSTIDIGSAFTAIGQLTQLYPQCAIKANYTPPPIPSNNRVCEDETSDSDSDSDRKNDP